MGLFWAGVVVGAIGAGFLILFLALLATYLLDDSLTGDSGATSVDWGD